MNHNELTYLFRPSHVLADRLLLVSPQEFRRLARRRITDSHVFILVCNGSLTVSVNGTDHEMRACSFLDVLDWAELSVGHTSDDLRAWCMMPGFDFTRGALKSLKPFPGTYMLNRIYRPVLSISAQDCATLEKQFLLIESAVSATSHCYRLELAQTYFKSMMLELGNIARQYSNEGQPDAITLSKRDMIMMGFMKLVHQYYEREHNVDFYAGRLCVSSKHLSRVISEVMGRTPHDIICNELLHKAMEQLKDNKMPIQEISTSLHFSDQASFCKFFKKHTGVSPSEYRKGNGG